MQRRQFLRGAGVSSLGAATAGIIAAGAASASEAKQKLPEVSLEDFEALKKSYAELDSRTKILFRAVLVLAGVDLLLVL